MKLRRTPLRWSGVSVLLSLIPATALAQTNMALDFDGVDDYVEVGDPVNLTGPLTLEAWVFARSATNSRRILSNRFGAGYEMDVDDSGPTIQLRLSFDGISRGSADFEPFMNTWTHVAATWGGPEKEQTSTSTEYAPGETRLRGHSVRRRPPSDLAKRAFRRASSTAASTRSGSGAPRWTNRRSESG